jgi:2,4-dienoyl-CoA reductase-like NADH-dependent reductase (Old Yellow Enzyme family)/thioredoxin reductase
MERLLKNEFIMAPLKLGYCHEKDGKVNERHLNFYQQRVEHLGAIISEPFYIHSGLRENPFQLGIDSDDKIEGIAKISELAHRHGTKFIAHINHPGRMANPNIPNNFYWSSSAVPCENGGVTPIAMDEEMMNIAIDTLVQAAIRAKKANADYIELQFGYGYLLSQFLSPQINLRADEYGGSFENRLKFPLRVLKSIQKNVDIPIIARVSATDFQPNGITIEESILLSQRLEKEGVVAIHVTAGSACSAPAWYYQHMFTQKGKNWEFANQIQNNVKIPVIFHGRINSNDDIKFLKEKYNAKYFSIGRALVADEQFVAKVLGKAEENIRPCLACSEGCLGGVRAGKGLGCVVNPKVNNVFPDIQKVAKPKNIAVVGGGLAGMEAAIQLANKGHNVTIYEKDKLGGQFLLAYLPSKKESLFDIVDFYKKEIERLKIPVVYKEATTKLIEKEGFDEVVIATGAKPVVPHIKGLIKYHWAEILEKPELIQNKRVLIIGGGLIGVEIASKLIDFHNQIIIVEMLDEIARGLEMIERNLTLAKFKQNNVQILLKHKVVELKDNVVIIENENQEIIQLENIDEIVVSVGMKSYRPFELSLPMHYVGDALKVAKAQDAIYEAYKLVTQI